MADNTTNPTWSQLLVEAVTKPGSLMQAYRAFHNYSSGNQMLAWLTCVMRGIQPGPIASFMAWKDKGRSVKKGEKAIALWMPVTAKRTIETKHDDGTITKEVVSYTRFVMKNNWFVIDQTTGTEYQPQPAPGWDSKQALAKLEVTEVPFDMTNGNCQGFARGRQLAINPLAQHPAKTLFHELGHILCGHTTETILDSEITPRNVREVEAEAVALICLESLGMSGAEYCRGYIQNWFGQDTIDDKSAQRIFQAADAILKAGRIQ